MDEMAEFTMDNFGQDDYSERYTHSATMHEAYFAAVGEMISTDKEIVRINNSPQFTEVFGGFRPREFTILCGSSGAGKTTLLANWAGSLAIQKVPFFVASVETGPNDFVRRTLSAIARKNFNDDKIYSVDEVKEITEKYGKYMLTRDSHMSLHENRFTVQELIADLKYHREKSKIQVAFVDNLNFFLEVTEVQKQVIEMDRVIHELIIFCKTTPIHLIMVMHPRKSEAGKDVRVRSEYDIKGSSTAVQEAHNVFLFNRPFAERVANGTLHKTDRELTVAKCRKKGSAVGKTFCFECYDTVSYSEKLLIGD